MHPYRKEQLSPHDDGDAGEGVLVTSDHSRFDWCVVPRKGGRPERRLRPVRWRCSIGAAAPQLGAAARARFSGYSVATGAEDCPLWLEPCATLHTTAAGCHSRCSSQLRWPSVVVAVVVRHIVFFCCGVRGATTPQAGRPRGQQALCPNPTRSPRDRPCSPAPRRSPPLPRSPSVRWASAARQAASGIVRSSFVPPVSECLVRSATSASVSHPPRSLRACVRAVRTLSPQRQLPRLWFLRGMRARSTAGQLTRPDATAARRPSCLAPDSGATAATAFPPTSTLHPP